MCLLVRVLIQTLIRITVVALLLIVEQTDLVRMMIKLILIRIAVVAHQLIAEQADLRLINRNLVQVLVDHQQIAILIRTQTVRMVQLLAQRLQQKLNRQAVIVVESQLLQEAARQIRSVLPNNRLMTVRKRIMKNALVHVDNKYF